MKITFFKSEWETYTPEEMCMEASWDVIADMLTTFVQVPSKEATEMYNLWSFRVQDGQIHRCKDDCIALHGLVLDYDQNLSMVDAVEQFAGFECAIYTTFNHGVGGRDKYRVVLPFAEPMPVAEFNKKRCAMIEAFPGVDRASFSRSQAIFLHSGPDAAQAFSARMSGHYLDWTVFEDEEVVEYTTAPARDRRVDPDFDSAYRRAVIESLASCRGFRHLNALSIVILLKSCGATFEDYCAVVSIAGDQDSCIQEDRSRTEAWAAVPDDVRIGRDKRDKFIAKFEGKPVRVERISLLEQKIQRLRGELNEITK
ncbi:hypothetical protein [Leptothrix discophora]|uniref:Uncharacterized protein n=1 Tax=Leptothrix discophora TaxID=89 RepID=A0ABT9G0G1_LEPDI|nr:hypothetical protein [Leptothrix discophora]MDP4299948.1 hypothetical protein [Leptothrix discophora]